MAPPKLTEVPTTPKRGRGRPPKPKPAGNGNGHDPLAADMDKVWEAEEAQETEGADARFDQEDNLLDPALFPELDQVRIPKLETRGREFAKQQDKIKKEKVKEKELGEECYRIMRDHNIATYEHGGVKLNIEDKYKLNVSVD